MKGLKAFLEVMGKDKELSEKVRNAKDIKEMVKIAKRADYEVTEEEMNDFLLSAVAGGVNFDMDTFLAGTLQSAGQGLQVAGQAKAQGASWSDAATVAGFSSGGGILNAASQGFAVGAEKNKGAMQPSGQPGQ